MAGRIKKIGKKVGKQAGKLFGLQMAGSFLNYTKGIAKRTLIPAKPGFKESFEEAVQRMNLDEEHLKLQEKKFLIQSAWFFVFALPVLGYSVYMAIKGSSFACFIAFLIAILLFAHSFRSHFWAFQIRNRKLGCTFAEWLSGKVKEG